MITTYEISKREIVEIERKEVGGPVECTRMYCMDEEPKKFSLWSYTFRTFECFEDAMNYYNPACNF